MPSSDDGVTTLVRTEDGSKVGLIMSSDIVSHYTPDRSDEPDGIKDG